MPISTRYDDPILDQIARDTFTLFPRCRRCGQPIQRQEDADIRVHLFRVVHRGVCPVPRMVERLLSGQEPATDAPGA